MRRTFINTLVELARKDERIHLLTGDLGFHVLEPFMEEFPDRFINVGVAEQNMIGIATGMAEAGLLPFAYSIATFASLRPYEFIRNGPVHHQLPVRVVGVGTGFDYGHGGFSHHALEDIGIFRMLMAIDVISPADAQQSRNALMQTYDLPKPIYYRLGKDDSLQIHGLDGAYLHGETQTVKTGDDVILISTGSITDEVVKAADLLAEKSINAHIEVISSLTSGSTAKLHQLLKNAKLAVTVEEHVVNGGIGSMTAEIIAEQGITCRLLRLGVEDMLNPYLGDTSYLRKVHKLDATSIADRVSSMIAAI